MVNLGAKEISLLNKIILDRNLNKRALKKTLDQVENGSITAKQYLLELFLSSSFLDQSRNNILEYHGYLIHHARLKAIPSLIPEAKNILDLGGANGSLYDMGYPHKFDKLTIIDLPPEKRVDMYKHLELKQRKTPNGPIEIHFGSVVDLDFIEDGSQDLVWAGEIIEHISDEDGTKMVEEAYRVLKPGGYFCLDTPNRHITKIHTSWRGGDFIHPEHKIEYYPKHLQRKLRKAGFSITDSRGICEMKNSFETKEFDYNDFIFGNALPYDVNSAYIQFYTCQKKPDSKFSTSVSQQLSTRAAKFRAAATQLTGL